MFTEPYLYYYLVATFFAFLQQRVLRANSELEILSPATATIMVITCGLGLISCLVFLILGFWFMPEWWYPLAFFGLKLATAWLPIPDGLGAKLGIVLVPVFSVLMYLDLFGVI